MSKVQKTKYSCGCVREYRGDHSFWVRWKICLNHDFHLQIIMKGTERKGKNRYKKVE